MPSAPEPEQAAERADAPRSAAPHDAPELGGAYANYVLGVLVLVYVLNFLDRQILSILNEEIKRDLGLSDAQMGFLYGTAFAVFYAVFGIPLGRLADVWNRRSLISIGLAFWSLMTALSGLARNFPQIAAARIGVGVGESSASPAAFSMLSDYFPPERRATVLAIYSGGIYIGAGLSLMIGGQIVERWANAFPAGDAPFGLAGWQVAFFAVGLPGLLLALWVRSLREPVRGQADGLVSTSSIRPWRALADELGAVLPPFTFIHLARHGGGALTTNVLAAVILALSSAALLWLTGDVYQWVALAIGLYAVVSWVQALWIRDAPTATLILATPSLRYGVIGLSFLAFTGYGLGYWTAPYFLRQHGVGSAEAGTILGLTAAVGGFVGVTLGGVCADALRRRAPAGRLWVAVATAILPVPFTIWMLTTDDLTTAYIANVPINVFASMWIGVGASTVQDLVLPRMRAAASAFYLLVLTFIGLALGPYTVGKLSDALGDLRTAMLWALLANAVALVLVLAAARHLARDEESLRDRARTAGEAV